MSITPDALSRYSIPDQLPKVYGIGLGARRVTFQAQQIRALNLVYHLENDDIIRAGSKVAIVGAGLAGLTSAAAFCFRGCNVTLIESKDEACPLFASNDQRQIYPNLFRWPSPESQVMETDLPFFNWSVGTPSDIVGKIKSARWPSRNEPACWYGMSVKRLMKHDNGRIFLTATKSRIGNGPAVMEDIFDVVVLAVGFGAEAVVRGITCPRYWSMDDFHQDQGSSEQAMTWLVSGTGDGAILDLLRLTVRNFNFDALYAQSSSCMMDRKFMAEVAEIESKAPVDPYDAAAYYGHCYRNMGVPDQLICHLQKRGHVHASINVGNGGFLNVNTLPFHRFLAHALNTLGMVDVLPLGRLIKGQVLKNGKTRAFFQTAHGTQTHDFDKVIPRHGPTPLDNHLVGTSLIKKMQALYPFNEDPTLEPAWTPDFYRKSPAQKHWSLSLQDAEIRKAAIFGLLPFESYATETDRARMALRTLNRRIG